MAEYKIQRPSSEYGVGECFKLLNEYQLKAHWYHLNSSSFEEHKASDFLVKGIEKLKDEILELILGYSPKEVSCSFNLDIKYGVGALPKLVDEFHKYCHKYYEIFEKLEYADLANKLADLMGVATKTKYLLTLK